MISKEDSRIKIDLEEIQESTDEEPIVNTDTQPEVVTPVKPDEENISDSTPSELDEPPNYKEVMAIPKAANEDESRIYVKVSGSVVVFLDRMSRVPYALDVGSIMYVMKYTRPYVSFTLSMVGRHQQNPGEGYWTPVKNILKYLRNTKDMFLIYGGEEELRVTGYCDAS
nr:retrotransposon protein putative Ty1-copia subclass [Tanacetum cinerariifolium]